MRFGKINRGITFLILSDTGMGKIMEFEPLTLKRSYYLIYFMLILSKFFLVKVEIIRYVDILKTIERRCILIKQNNIDRGIHSLLEILLVSTRLGLTSFGGPIAHLGYFHEEYIHRRKWS